MSRDWKKYGSPYDPNYQGKMKRPEEQRREQDQFSVRGCGDPTCAQCNPETAYAIARGDIRMSSDQMRRIMEEAMRNRGGGFSDLIRGARVEFISMDDYPAQPRGGPPASYTKAREGVEKWLAKVPDQSFDDIVGNEESLGQLREAIEAPIKHKELYEAYGMKMPKGAMLSGPPGCGKTMFARAAASEMNRLYGTKKKEFEFISISGSELQSPYIGVTEGYIKAIFDFAREFKSYHGYPLLVFMDEADVILPDRTGRIRRVAMWEESNVATFLAEMDGMQESGAFVLLATNRPEVIDQAVLRDGRCDFKITVKKPTREAIESIIRKNFTGQLMSAPEDELVFAAVEMLHDPHKIILEAHALAINFELEEIKDMHTKHFLLEHIVSGAMAASIPNRAKRYAFTRDKETGKAVGITVADVLSAVNDLYEENKNLEHSFAMNEFRTEFMKEAEEIRKSMNEKKGRLN